MKKVLLPRSLFELWEDLENMPESSLYAGGTDLLVKMRGGFINPPSLVCLDRIEELKGISPKEDGSTRIGGCTTHTAIMAHPGLRRDFPSLVRAIEGLGSPQIRNMGTIGGNICTASPAGDTLPPLYVLGAEVELCSRQGVRRIPVRDFIVGPGKTKLNKGEILSAVWIKKPDGYNFCRFEKVGERNALACSVASLASLLFVSEDGVVENAALAWGSVAPTIFTSSEVEEALEGERLSLEKLEEVAAIVRQGVSPISDVRASADYRRAVSGNLLLRLVESIDKNSR